MVAAVSLHILEPKPLLILLLTVAGCLGWAPGGIMDYFITTNPTDSLVDYVLCYSFNGSVIGLALAICLALSARTPIRVLLYPICTTAVLMLAIPTYELVTYGRVMSPRQLADVFLNHGWTATFVIYLPGAGLLTAHLTRWNSLTSEILGFAVLGALTALFVFLALGHAPQSRALWFGMLTGLSGGLAQFAAVRVVKVFDRRMENRNGAVPPD
jgi:hypothetical protein